VGLLAVAPNPASAALVRHSIAADLLSRHIDHQRVDDVILVASELVTNAVLHAPTRDHDELDVTWEVGCDSVVVGVLDNNPDLPRGRTTTSESDTRGRGLYIVAALALDWGVRRTDHGKQVWARLPLH
jgi:anti-sigma regulatory factor (Ser/Thr protein kinase)